MYKCLYCVKNYNRIIFKVTSTFVYVIKYIIKIYMSAYADYEVV